MFNYTRREQIGAVILSVLLVTGLILRFFFLQTPGGDIIIEPAGSQEEDSEIIQKEIYVHVAGAVKTPGVYCLYDGDRVCGALELAGGMTDGADRDALNLAAPLYDGQKVLVPFLTERSASEGALTAEGLVNINTAREAELAGLPGIGPVKAAAITEYREKNGPFKGIDDLTAVTGIGAKTVESLRGLITIY